MLYNDWQPTSPLRSLRQLSWSILHFPFHLATVLFVGGSAQFIMWWKISETNKSFGAVLDTANGDFTISPNVTKIELLSFINDTVHDTFLRYPPPWYLTEVHYSAFYSSLENLSDAFWANLTAGDDQSGFLTSPEMDKFTGLLESIIVTVENSLFATFKIDSFAEGNLKEDPATYEFEVLEANFERLDLVVSPCSYPCGMFQGLYGDDFVLTQTPRVSTPSSAQA